ncbi:MAG: site-specific DNA-methyltransferase [Patescibacteria group bacterium]
MPESVQGSHFYRHRVTSESGGNRNSTGLDGHSGPPPLSLFLLQPEKFQNDSRPQNPIEQRREKLAREHSASLPQVQLHKEGQNRVDAKEEIDCLGCYMCENQNGFIFTLSAGRCTKSHEYIFLMSKSPKYYFDNEAIKEKRETNENRPDAVVRDRIFEYESKQSVIQNRNRDRRKDGTISGKGEPNLTGIRTGGNLSSAYKDVDWNEVGRNKRSVWTITTKPFAEAHFATFPEALIIPMVKAGCPLKGIVLDIFMGAGTTAKVAKEFGRNYVGIELNPEYIKIAERRLLQDVLDL